MHPLLSTLAFLVDGWPSLAQGWLFRKYFDMVETVSTISAAVKLGIYFEGAYVDKIPLPLP